MDTFELNVIDNNVSLRNRDGLGRRFLNAIIFISIVLLLSRHLNALLTVSISFIALIITSKLTRRMLKDWLSHSDTIGKAVISSDAITLTHLNYTIYLNDVKRISLIGNYFQGYSGNPRDITHNGLYWFEIELDNGNSIEFKLIVFSKSEFEVLTEFIKYIYSNSKIQINEKICNEHYRGFVLRHNRSFKETQQLKQELGLMN